MYADAPLFPPGARRGLRQRAADWPGSRVEEGGGGGWAGEAAGGVKDTRGEEPTRVQGSHKVKAQSLA